MQRFKLSFWVLASILVLNACKGGNKKTDDKTAVNNTTENGPITNTSKLEGRWECVKVETDYTEQIDVGNIFEFKDTLIYMNKQGYSMDGSVHIDDTSFTVKTIFETRLFHYRFKGDTLVVYELPSYYNEFGYYVKKEE